MSVVVLGPGAGPALASLADVEAELGPLDVLVGAAGPVEAAAYGSGLQLRELQSSEQPLRTAAGLVTSRYVTVVEADDELVPQGLAACLSSLERTGSTVAVGRRRPPAQGLRPSPWPNLPACGPVPEHGTRLTARPDVLVDLSWTAKVFDSAWWRSFIMADDLRDDVAPVVRAMLAVPGADVLDIDVLTGSPQDARLPVDQQRRFRPESARQVGAALTQSVEDIRSQSPAACGDWSAGLLTHVLPPRYVDAVGGGPAYLDALRFTVQGLLDSLSAEDLAGVPVAQRLAAHVAATQDWASLARLLDFLMDHVNGLPCQNGMVDLATTCAERVPPQFCRIEPVDRVPHIQVGDVRRQGDQTAVRVRAFVEHTEQQTPEVWLDGVAMEVQRRVDHRVNEWAASPEDRSDASFVAVGAAGLSSGPGPFEVTVQLGGARAGLRRGRQPADPRDRSVVVDEALLVPGGLSISGTSPSRLQEAWLSGPKGSTARAAVTTTDGRLSTVVPLTTGLFGETVPLPYGTYRLCLRPGPPEAAEAGAGPTVATWARALSCDPPSLVNDRQGLSLVGDDRAQVEVGAPLRTAEVGVFGQHVGRMAYASVRRPSWGRTVLLETFRGRAVGDSPGAVARELATRALDLDLVWVVDDASVAVPEGSRAVVRRSHDWHQALANARVYVANAAAPAFFAKKPGQVHIQTWHGTPLKRIGEDRGPGDFFTWRHRRMVARQASSWDALLSPSPYCSTIFRSAFRYGGPILESGYPRNDVLTSPTAQSRRQEVRTLLGLRDQDTVVLYAPTWREYLGQRDAKPLYLDPELATRAVADSVVLVRGHYNATGQPDLFRGRRSVQDVTRYPDIAGLLLACDVLVTDYSSVMFDFSLTDKPVILLVPDLERYRDAERGFYLELEDWAPGPMVRSTEEVVQALAAPDSHGPARRRMRETFCPWDDGRAAERVADHLLDLMRHAL